MCGMSSTFKAYSTLGDCVLQLSLVPLFHKLLFSKMRHSSFVYFNTFLTLSFLSPLFSKLWLYDATGNSNFSFALSLVFGLTQVMLMLDLSHFTLLHLYSLKHKIKSTASTLPQQ